MTIPTYLALSAIYIIVRVAESNQGIREKLSVSDQRVELVSFK